MSIRLIIDAMGGDHAPGEIVLGAAMALREIPSLSLIFTGDRESILRVLDKSGVSRDRVRIVHTESVMEMEDDPLLLLKSKKDSSMARGFALLRDGEGDAFLSAGSTGAMLIGASSRIYKNRLPGVRRCALGAVLPFKNPTLLLDAGANPEVSAEELAQFAHMGSAYMQAVFGMPRPRVGLVNNGGEDTKGTPVYVEAHHLLKGMDTLNFIGNVEGRDLPLGACDVAVCDGFTGNVILKLAEGFGKFLSLSLEKTFRNGPLSGLSYVLIRKDLEKFKADMSYEKYGGAPLLGTVKPVIKAHGASRAEAIKNAVHYAVKYASSDASRSLYDLFSERRDEKPEAGEEKE
ncbi:MAG: phosphate acyltransferase PlsX [Clostridia bacterium]|nr:phosphate acyltransferase PlsX [Clostridia bacterium]